MERVKLCCTAAEQLVHESDAFKTKSGRFAPTWNQIGASPIYF
jgi:hypothetical protein